jgi:TIR domain
MEVFISHKSEDKQEAIRIKHYLQRCFINVWLDKDELKGGDALSSAFIKGVKGKTTVALITENYVDSDWCRNEFEMAYTGQVTKKGSIIPVILGTGDTASAVKIKAEKAGFDELVSLMEGHKYLLYNIYKPEHSCQEISEAVQKNNPIRFKALKPITVQGQEMQFIDFEMDKATPLEVFQTWQVDLMDFMDFHNDGSKPIKKEIPIAFFGKGACWFYAFLSTPFANKNEVFVYNEPTNKYLCVYARPAKKEMMGLVLMG